MEISTISNVVALANQILESSDHAAGTDLSAKVFEEIVFKIFDKVNMFSKWEKTGANVLRPSSFKIVIILEVVFIFEIVVIFEVVLNFEVFFIVKVVFIFQIILFLTLSSFLRLYSFLSIFKFL